MPTAAPRPCSKHPEVLLYRGDKCDKCSKYKNKQKKDKRKRSRFYDSSLWRNVIRPAKLSKDPFCQMCLLKNRHVVATDVDHIVSIEKGGSKTDDFNLQSLCHSCHSAKTATLDGGFGNRIKL